MAKKLLKVAFHLSINVQRSVRVNQNCLYLLARMVIAVRIHYVDAIAKQLVETVFVRRDERVITITIFIDSFRVRKLVIALFCIF